MSRCLKPRALCICDAIEPIRTRLKLVILQHPQEQDRTLGTARLAALQVEGAILKVGLSWPSLSRILGHTVDPQRWAILYLGSVRPGQLSVDRAVVAVDRKGEPELRQTAILSSLEGIVVLDGTWSQAKALWWRNPWMLKCRRIVLNPDRPSLYGKLRREPRREGLSTIETIALTLSDLERRPEIETAMNETFARMLAAYRQAAESDPSLAPSPRRGRDRRRRGTGQSHAGND